jgi:predicted ATP-grasp superfamily ATP-dependent carboligase
VRDVRTLPATVRTLGALALLAAAAPVAAVATGAALATARLLPAGRRQAPVAQERLTVLVSGGKMTKALILCRVFHAAGHRVVLVEAEKYRWTGHRASRSVDVFRTIPGPTDPGYAAALLRVVEEESVDVYVPVCAPATAIADARAKALLETRCRVLHLEPGEVELLDDKAAFARRAAELGLPVPETHEVRSAEEVLAFDFAARPGRSFILKSIAYDPVHRLDLTRLPFGRTDADRAAMRRHVEALPIGADNPWILQEHVTGQELCTHGTVVDGELRVHLCCESSAFQVNYAMVDRPRVRAWVESFVGELGLTGQVSFDFIEGPDGTPYAIECNPRTHSAITMVEHHPALAAAYLGGTFAGEPLAPEPSSRPTYWLYHELWRLLVAERPRTATLRVLREGRDAMWDRRDPLPFLLEHHRQVPVLLLRSLVRRRDWIRIDFNIGKLVEAAGD